jgi:flagellar protein FliO/FliZ
MLRWLRDRNASQRVGVIESVQLDGKRSIKLVRRDNIEHLVLVGGRNDVVIEPNIVRRPTPKPAHGPALQMSALPPPGVQTREPLAGRPRKSHQHDLGELTHRLEAELRGSPPRGRHSPPLRAEAESLTQADANVQLGPDGEDAVPNDGTEKSPARAEVEKDQ